MTRNRILSVLALFVCQMAWLGFAFLVFILPRFAKEWFESGKELPKPIVAVVNLSQFLQAFAWLLVPLLLVVTVLAFKCFLGTLKKGANIPTESSSDSRQPEQINHGKH